MNKLLLEKLCNANGISGDESTVRNIIISEIKNSGAKYHTDNMGNLIVFKKGKCFAKKAVNLSPYG